MASTLYGDRGFVSVNGQELVDVVSITVRMTDGTRYVPTMTRDRRHRGVVKGNRDISCNVVVAVQNSLGTPKLEAIDYQSNDVAITFQHGEAGDRYTLKGVDLVDMEQAASGIGTEGRKTFNFLATNIIDQVGNSILFQFGG